MIYLIYDEVIPIGKKYQKLKLKNTFIFTNLKKKLFLYKL